MGFRLPLMGYFLVWERYRLDVGWPTVPSKYRTPPGLNHAPVVRFRHSLWRLRTVGPSGAYLPVPRTPTCVLLSDRTVRPSYDDPMVVLLRPSVSRYPVLTVRPFRGTPKCVRLRPSVSCRPVWPSLLDDLSFVVAHGVCTGTVDTSVVPTFVRS